MNNSNVQQAAASTRRRKTLAAWSLSLIAGTATAAQVVVPGPTGSGSFGHSVTVLPNGNFVVVDPLFDSPGPIVDVGAVYLYRPDGALVSTLRGSTANDRVGGDGVMVLSNGNYLVFSRNWNNGAATNAGAVTFGSAVTGISGIVSAGNSLVGSTTNDLVGSSMTDLSNGNYVVHSYSWNNGAATETGAITFASGVTGISGIVSASNSLVGSSADDRVGSGGITVLHNGNYVVSSPYWANGTATYAGAVTFGSGVTGISGIVSASNSLVGSSPNDVVGFFSGGVVVLSNGNYVVVSARWNNGAVAQAGAVTFGSGVTGVRGIVSPANSLVGSRANDRVGGLPGGVTVLSNGNYVVASPSCANGTIGNAGAVTFGSGVTGISGSVSAINSLVGVRHGDSVGSTVTALRNGNYVVGSPEWENGTALLAGAATFASGTTGISGFISPGNSLVGSSPYDQIGRQVIALSSGNYVVYGVSWDNGAAADAGFATFGSGTTGVSGAISPINSLVGSQANDQVGSSGVVPLRNGNYLVSSHMWNNGAVTQAGAVTFGSGDSGISGTILPSNSLVGSTANDRVGFGGTMELSNSNFVVRSPYWTNGAAAQAGAATFGSGITGISGIVSPSNSLVGSTASDLVAGHPGGVVPLSNGNYVVSSPVWNNGAAVYAGAATFGSGVTGISGVVSLTNSLVGSTAFDRVSENLGIDLLSNGNYVVRTPYWTNGTADYAGAVTVGSGIVGISGIVSPSNSMVGSAPNDLVGYELTTLSNGNYAVRSPDWNNGAIVDAGAITLALADGSVTGPLTNTHSALGLVSDAGFTQVFGYDAQRNQLAAGQPASNRVVLQRTGIATAISIVGDTPDPSFDTMLVTFTANVSAASAPINGQVTFRANTGESCTATTLTAISATTVAFACDFAFILVGVSNVIAEFTGSTSHAYSGSDPELHTVAPNGVFGNGFEGL